jgi:uncharacterized protein
MPGVLRLLSIVLAAVAGALFCISAPGAPKDPVREARLLLQAAQGGDANAEFSYGMMRLDGYPEGRVRKGHDEAMRWLKKAAAKGHARAQAMVAELELPLDFQLLRAIERGSKADALRALERGASVNAGDPLGRSALGHAAGSGQADLVENFLLRGANVNAASADGTTPLISAARFGDPQIVRALVVNGADVNTAQGNGETALSHARSRLGEAPAGRKNFEAVVRILVEAGAGR